MFHMFNMHFVNSNFSITYMSNMIFMLFMYNMLCIIIM